MLRSVYGLPDAGDYWSDTLTNHLREHCLFTQAPTDLSLWLCTVAGKVLGIAATYVDSVLVAVNPDALQAFKEIFWKRIEVAFQDN